MTCVLPTLTSELQGVIKKSTEDKIETAARVSKLIAAVTHAVQQVTTTESILDKAAAHCTIVATLPDIDAIFEDDLRAFARACLEDARAAATQHQAKDWSIDEDLALLEYAGVHL